MITTERHTTRRAFMPTRIVQAACSAELIIQRLSLIANRIDALGQTQ